MEKKYFSLILVFITLFILQACKDSNDTSVSPMTHEYDWEGEVGKFNEPYRDSIIFNSDRSIGTAFAPSVHMMYKDGTGIHAKTTEWFTFGACWSPRKWKIFFMADTSFGESARSVYVMDANGANKKRITDPAQDIIGLAVAPDGKKIAYVVNFKNAYSALFVANPDGSNPKQITEDFRDFGFIMLSWSSDSKRIAYDGADYRIKVVNADGSNNGILFEAPKQCHFPAWSPDGTKMVYTSWGDDSPDIFIFDFENKINTRITYRFGFVQSPKWSPDGKKIIFAKRGENTPDHIYIMNRNGSDLQEITTGIGSDWGAVW